MKPTPPPIVALFLATACTSGPVDWVQDHLYGTPAVEVDNAENRPVGKQLPPVVQEVAKPVQPVGQPRPKPVKVGRGLPLVRPPGVPKPLPKPPVVRPGMPLNSPIPPRDAVGFNPADPEPTTADMEPVGSIILPNVPNPSPAVTTPPKTPPTKDPDVP